MVVLLFACNDCMADRKMSYGGISCSVPDDWRQQDRVYSTIRCSAPKSFAFVGSRVRVQLLIEWSWAGDNSQTLDGFLKWYKPRILNQPKELSKLIGKAHTGTGKLTQRDLANPICKLVRHGDVKILKASRLSLRTVNGESLVYKHLSFHHVEDNEQRSLVIWGPKGQIDGYEAEIEKIVASLRFDPTIGPSYGRSSGLRSLFKKS